MHLFVLLLFFVTLPSQADTSLAKLSEEPKWLKLLHYKKNILGGYTSQADDKKFFLHPDGRTNPLKEIETAVSLFALKMNPVDGDPACQFPLRFKWLNEKLGYPWKINFSGCEKYVSFFSKLAAKRASIVFSSYYLSNPNTAFGHTFLRLSRYDDRAETEMLDYGINYSVQTKITNPFSYAIKGLVGGFKGVFAAIPYYYKVREYSNSEFRDLWSYDLHLNLKQVLEMVDHIWELGSTHFDYFYFHENCSYHLLSVIEVAIPERNLTDEYSVFTIPADTIRHLQKEGLITEGKRRESTYSKLLRLSDDLSHKDLSLSKEISEKPENTLVYVKGLEDKKAANILDVSLEAFDYNNADKILTDDPATKARKEHILVERARNPVITVDQIQNSVYDSPAFSHPPSRMTLTQGYLDTFGKSNRLDLRFAFHDLMDPPRGSLKDAQLEMGSFSFLALQNNYGETRPLLNHFSIFSLKNFPEQNFWASPLSWEIDVGAKQIYRRDCFDCPGGFINASVGNSLQLLQKKVLLALLFNGDFMVQSYFDENFALGLGPKLYARFAFSEKFFMALESTYHLNTYSYQDLGTDQRFQGSWEARYHMSSMYSLMGRLTTLERDDQWVKGGELGLQIFY